MSATDGVQTRSTNRTASLSTDLAADGSDTQRATTEPVENRDSGTVDAQPHLGDVWAAYEAGVRSGQRHPDADDSLISKSADAYVKSIWWCDLTTGVMHRSASPTPSPTPDAAKLVDTPSKRTIRMAFAGEVEEMSRRVARELRDRDDEIERLANALQAACAERDALKADMEYGAGECLVPCPEPGTHLARVVSANVLMRRELATLRAAREREGEEAKDAERWDMLRESLEKHGQITITAHDERDSYLVMIEFGRQFDVSSPNRIEHEEETPVSTMLDEAMDAAIALSDEQRAHDDDMEARADAASY